MVYRIRTQEAVIKIFLLNTYNRTFVVNPNDQLQVFSFYKTAVWLSDHSGSVCSLDLKPTSRLSLWSSQLTTSPTSGQECTASERETTRPGHPNGTEGIWCFKVHDDNNGCCYFFFLPTNVLLPLWTRPNVFLLLNVVFFLRSVLASRPWIQSSRWDSHLSCFNPAGWWRQEEKSGLLGHCHHFSCR